MTDSIVRRDQEPRGRWETRCDFLRKSLGMIGPGFVCDRPTGHAGMHSGRLIGPEFTVIGYARLRT